MLTTKFKVPFFIGFSVISLMGLNFYLVELSQRISQTQEHWIATNERFKTTSKILESILSELGYNGFIHNFKNYVLRDDPVYLSAANKNLSQFRKKVNDLKPLITDEQGRQALQILVKTIEQYQANTVLVELNSDKLSIRQLDALVRVDDTEASKAIDILIKLITAINQQESLAIQAQTERDQQFLAYGSLVMIIIAVLTFLLIVAMLRTERGNKALKEAMQRIDALINASPDALMVVNKSGEIIRTNDMAMNIFECNKKQLIGQRVESLIPPRYANHHKDKRDKFMLGNNQIAMSDRRDLKALKPNGKEFDVEVSLNRFEFEGLPAIILIIRDVTHQRHIEQAANQKTKLESLGQITAGVAHDFNNILMTISGNNELIEFYISDPDKVKQFLKASMGAVHRASELTTQLLAFGRKQPLKAESFKLTNLVEYVNSTIFRTLGENISLVIEIDDDVEPIDIDKAQLESALLNLCINAKHSMPSGGKIIIRAENTTLDNYFVDEFGNELNGTFVMLSVSDTGRGISEEHLAHIFEPFFTTKEQNVGSGMGLSMVYGFVQQSNGHIKVYTEENVGTSIKLFLPITNNEIVETNKNSEFENDSATAIAPKHLTVLVVEDDDQVRSIPVLLLQHEGFNVVEASMPEDALAIAKSTDKIDVLFTDIILSSEINGIQLAKQIQGVHPDIKVIYTTGYVEEEFVADFSATDVYKIVKKPYSKKTLLEALSEGLTG